MLPTDLTMHEELIEVVLAHHDKWTFEPKIDGFRMMTCCYDDHIECWTRNHNRVEKLEQYFLKNMNWKKFAGYIVDGEIYENNIRRTISIVSGPETITKLQYYMFDLFPIEYADRLYTTPLRDRRKKLDKLYKEGDPSRYMIRVPYYPVNAPLKKEKEYILDLGTKYVQKGYEGIVIKRYDSPYEHKRTKMWLKVKKVYSLDLRCIKVVESKTKPGMVGALMVDVCGVNCLVGSGLSQKQRFDFWYHPEQVVNHIVEVKFFEKTPAGKLRHPVFVRIRDDKSRPDC